MIKIKPDRLVVYTAVIISLIFTSMNFDALIIPKVALLFVLALYILPELIAKNKKFFSDPNPKPALVLINSRLSA